LVGKWSIATLTQPVTNPQSQHSRKTGCQHKTHKDESEVASGLFNHGAAGGSFLTSAAPFVVQLFNLILNTYPYLVSVRMRLV